MKGERIKVAWGYRKPRGRWLHLPKQKSFGASKAAETILLDGFLKKAD
jgi:hypothetical protein